MPVPWLRILDALIGITDLARSRRIKTLSQSNPDPNQQLEGIEKAGAGPRSTLEARLAGVVVAALKETFDRDSHRLELERAQIEAERERHERTLRLELQRQAGEREIGRLRLLALVAVASWIATLLLGVRLMSGPVGPRVALAAGWVVLLAAVAMSFMAQAHVGAELDRGDSTTDPRDVASSGLAGGLVPWLIVIGLALVGLAVLVV
jgi:hypothetical protein